MMVSSPSALFVRVINSCITRRLSSVSRTNNYPKEKDIVTEVFNRVGVITLNRPKLLNALSLPMITEILSTLREWEDKVECVIARANGVKAFCSGGDIFKITEDGPSNCQYGKRLFREEYTKIYTISQYKIPYIALTNGITMGGGVGMSRTGKYCIATENSLFAMPETAVGLCPDVGTSYFFSRLEGKLGLYLALTGHRLQGKDGVKIGFANHYVESKDISTLFEEILKLGTGDVEGVINKYSQDVSNHLFSLAPHMDLISKAFSAPTVEEILQRLQSNGCEFSKMTVKQLNRMSPIALKTVKVALEKAAYMTLKECLQMEFRLSRAAMEATSSTDLYEGTRALKEKRAPKWNPAKLEDVSEDMVNKLFKPIPPEEELKLKKNNKRSV